MPSPSIQIKITFLGREELSIHLIVDEQNQIQKSELKGIGSLKFLRLLEAWREKLKGDYKKIPVPLGNEPEALILREALMKVKGEWQYPYQKEKLCYCRNVLTHEIDKAIMSGAKTPDEVSLLTGASTGCGTCRIHVEKILNFKLKKSSAS